MRTFERSYGWTVAFAALAACAPRNGAAPVDTNPTIREEPPDTDSADSGDSGEAPTPCARARFAAVGTDVKLPSEYGSNAFRTVDGTSADLAHVLRDLDGDGSPEIVVTRTADTGTTGTRRWIVHPLGDDGFAPGFDWLLPATLKAPAGDTWFDADPKDVNWSVRDVDGDGRVDLVVTQDPADATLGRTAWRVWRGALEGFATAAEDWKLPLDRGAGAFARVDDADPVTSPDWSLRDMDGDRAPDLLVTRDDAGGSTALGATEWWVFKNEGAGFAEAPHAWALPTDVPAGTFAIAAGDAAPEIGPAWALVDLDADGLPDLVVTRDDTDPASTLGTDHWLVWRNTGAGFAAAPVEWALPEGFATGTFCSADDRYDGGAAWTLRDLSGDGTLDLVVADTGAERGEAGPVGVTHWQLYANEGAGFATAPAMFVLPTGYPEAAFRQTEDRDNDGPAWAIRDLTRDGALDLVLTSWKDGTDPALGDTRWRVHASECATE